MTNSISAITSSTASSASTQRQALITTSTNALFQMANLTGRVRQLSQQASALRSSDTDAVSALRTQVNDTLSQFTKIATAAGVDTTATATATSNSTASSSTSASTTASTSTTKANAEPAPLTLAEMQSTLATMQTTLRQNINKIGSSVQKALMTNATADAAQTSLSSSSWLAAWSKQRASNKSYL